MPSEPSNCRPRGRSRVLATGGSGLTAVLAVLALAFAPVLPWAVSPGHAEQPVTTSPQHTAVSAQETLDAAPVPTLVVSPTEPVLTATATEVTFNILLRNPTDMPLEAGEIVLSIDNVEAESIADLDDGSDRDSLEFVQLTAEPTPAGEDQLIETVVPRDEMPLTLTRQPGVYPVRAEFVPFESDTPSDLFDSIGEDSEAAADEGSGEAQESIFPLQASTSMIWESIEPRARAPITLIVPLLLPDTINTLPGSTELDSVAPQLLELLDAAELHNATLAVDPRILAATRALGEAAPADASTLVERLESTSQRVFLLQFADADPAVQAALGFDTLLQPIGFEYATSFGRFEPVPPDPDQPTDGDDAPHNDAAESSEADDEPANVEPADDEVAEHDVADNDTEPLMNTPSPEELMSLANAAPGAWPAGGEVDSATLALLQRSGLDFIVLDSTNASSMTGTRATLGSFEALIADSRLTQAASASLAAATPAEQAAGDAQLAALLALSAENESTGAVLALDRGAMAVASDPLRVFSVLDEMPWVQTVPDTLQPEGTATLRSGSSGEQRQELLQAAMERSVQINELAPLLAQPAYLLEYQRERLLDAFATRYASPQIDLDETNTEMQLRDEALLEGVRPVTTESTQLVGTSSHVPVTLSNALPFDAAVSLHAAPFSAAISLTDRDFDAAVPAEGSSVVLVPVHSRISSGESALLLEVRDAAGGGSYATSEQHLVLRTAVEGILLGVLGSAAALLLGFGVWRSVKRKRLEPEPDGAVSA